MIGTNVHGSSRNVTGPRRPRLRIPRSEAPRRAATDGVSPAAEVSCGALTRPTLVRTPLCAWGSNGGWPAFRNPTVLLLSTSDTDLITARASGAGYRWANPSRLVDGELEELLAGADIAVVRILGGYRAWQDGIDTVVASGVPTVVVSGEQSPDAELMGQSTTPAGVALQSHIYLAQGGIENLRQPPRVPERHALDDRLRVCAAGATTPTWGVLRPRVNA